MTLCFERCKQQAIIHHCKSNHLPSVLKQISKSVSKRITANSFLKSVPFYNSILHDCGFNQNLTYCPEEQYHQEEGGADPETSFDAILLSAKI